MPEEATAYLLDANLLIALLVADHVHHAAAEQWTAAIAGLATCPMTQGALVRFLIREGATGDEARLPLEGVTSDPRHSFWADDLDYQNVDLRAVVGHRQVTDAYLAALARTHGGRVATFDGGLAATHPDEATLVPTVQT